MKYEMSLKLDSIALPVVLIAAIFDLVIFACSGTCSVLRKKIYRGNHEFSCLSEQV